MRHSRAALTSGLFVLALFLVVILTILITSEMEPVWADGLRQPVVTTVNDDLQYLRLKDAPPQRDITKQRFAPLEKIR